MEKIIQKIKEFFEDIDRVVNKEEISLEPSKPKKIRISEKDNIQKIEVLEPCTLEEFQVPIEIPIPCLLREGLDLLNVKILKQTIYTYEENDYTYFISKNEDFFLLSERKKEKEHIVEIELKIDKQKKKYSVSKYIHDLNYSTKEIKKYPMKEDNTLDFFRMEKIEAIKLLQGLVNRIDVSEKIEKFLYVHEIYAYLHLLPEKDFNPVIIGNKVTLSVHRAWKGEDFLSINTFSFDIVINETKEKVGNIGYWYQKNGGFTYGGNVNYDIDPEFRHLGYATLALELLKNLLKEHKMEGDKDLYISALPNNLYSQKVAINNQGELFYNGPVPEEELLNSLDGVKEVVVYRIKMKK